MRFRGTAVLLTLAILESATVAEGKYDPPEFFELAGLADVIVRGEIVKVNEKSFTLRVSETLAGREDATELDVLQFVDWTCAHRWKPYAVGQEEVAFLRRLDEKERRETGARFALLSSGDEGEWEIVGSEVSVQGFRVPGGRLDDQGEHPGQWLPLDVVLDAIRHYRSCFSVHGDYRNREVRKLCATHELEQYRRRSTVHAYLVQTSEEEIAAYVAPPTSGPLPPDKLRQ
jgi:hypothetical protein